LAILVVVDAWMGKLLQAELSSLDQCS